jgi:hypothetical protein
VIEFNKFMEVLIRKLSADGVLPGVFFTPSGKGLTPLVDELKIALDAELRKY